MREAIGNSFVYSMVIAIIGVLFLILIGSLSYSKAFKAKTRIIEIIEKHETFDDAVSAEIDSYLKSVGYKVTNTSGRGTCADVNGTKAINTRRNFDYCVYRFNTVKGPYYRVTAFISFEIPVISSYLRIPVSGETRVIFEL